MAVSRIQASEENVLLQPCAAYFHSNPHNVCSKSPKKNANLWRQRHGEEQKVECGVRVYANTLTGALKQAAGLSLSLSLSVHPAQPAHPAMEPNRLLSIE